MGDSKDRYYRIKNECIVLLGGKCASCGSEEDLEFDHIDPSTKLFAIDGGSRYSRVRREEELKKCQLLCSECHKRKTSYDVKSRRRQHGSKTMYNQGCKCEECRVGHNSRMREYRRRRRARVVQMAETVSPINVKLSL